MKQFNFIKICDKKKIYIYIYIHIYIYIYIYIWVEVNDLSSGQYSVNKNIKGLKLQC